MAQTEGSNLKIELYPNPATSYVYINYEGAGDNAELRLYDMLGNIIDMKQIGDEYGVIRFDTQGLSAGQYILEIKGDLPSISRKVLHIVK